MFRSCCCVSSLPPLEGNVWLLYHHLNGELFLPRLSQGFFFLSLQLCFLFHTLFQWLLFFFLLLPATAVCYILWFLHRNSRTGWITGSMQVSWSHDRIRNFLLWGGGEHMCGSTDGKRSRCCRVRKSSHTTTTKHTVCQRLPQQLRRQIHVFSQHVIRFA